MAEISKMAVNNTTYDIKDTSARAALVPATINSPGLMSAADKSKLDNIANYATANVGTVTGIKVNGERIGTANGTVLDIGTVLSSHQDISGKADFDETVTNVSYNGTQKKIYKTIGDADPIEVVSVATLKTALSLAKSDIGLGNVDNKSAATIISEITAQDVINSLGYTPPQTNTTYTLTQDTNDAHKLIFTPSSGTAKTITMPDTNTWTELSTTAGGYVGTPLPGSDNVFLNGLGGWTAPPSAVTSVAGQTGTVTLNKGDVGLANVDNTSDANKPISTATQSALDLKLNTSLKGAANGLAELDSNGKVPSAQLPSYVDDILEYADIAHFPVQGESGKIYVAQDTNLTYRWGTNSYVEISPSIALGETASTAYAGDKGAAAYAHAVTNKGIEVYDTYQGAKVAKFVKVLTNAEGHIIASVDVAKADITALGIPGQDTTYTFDGTYNASTNKVATVSTVTTAISNLGAAASKAVDTSISSSNGTSTSVPTTAAVYTFVTGQNYLTSHQDITSKADKLYTVSSVDYDGTNLKLTKTINGTTSDILTVATLKSDLNFTKSDLGLGNVENKSSATIRGELTSTNVTTALGFTPIANNSVASSSALGLVKIGYTTSDRNYAVQLDSSNMMYVNVPWTDHYAWSDITGKPLTLTKNTTGFSISGGTTSKTLTVGADYTLGAACAKGVTDNSSSTAVTSTDTNLITARTLYYAGYVKSSGVTSVATGAGLTGGTITSTGTISINGMDTSSGSTSKCLTQKGTWVAFNNYSHPTGAGNNHIPSGGSANQYLKYSSSGVATWSALPTASTSASGIVSLSSSLSSTSETVAATAKAVKTLNDNIAFSSGTFTPTVSGTISNYGTMYYYKFGRVAQLKIDFKNTNAQPGFGTRSTIALNIPNALKPTVDTSCMLGNGDTDGIQCCQLTTSGNLIIYWQKSGLTYVQGTLTYITAS